MSTLADYRSLVGRLSGAMPLPRIESILLPREAPPPEKKDEFGFVMLEEGSVGPFYLCLGDTYGQLARRLAGEPAAGQDPVALAMQLGRGDLAASALALGAYNAISQHLMRRAGFDPAAGGKGEDTLKSARRIGMVGYFPPLAERLRARGLILTIIEQLPERVPEDPGISLFATPDALGQCDHVLCTASTLINDTIDQILHACLVGARVELIGPSASGLPDPLFARGVEGVGGIVIEDPKQLQDALESGESWGASGRKYSLQRAGYPGVQGLLDLL